METMFNYKCLKNDFVLIDNELSYDTYKIFSRSQINSENKYHLLQGDFLSRIWSNYGKPKYENFYYTFMHKKTGIMFTAYSGADGNAYGGFDKDKQQLKEILILFEKLLMSSKLIDCSLALKSDYGTYIIGVKNCIPFHKSIEKNNQPSINPDYKYFPNPASTV